MKTKKISFKLINKTLVCDLTYSESEFRLNSEEFGILIDGYYTKGYEVRLHATLISRSIEMFSDSLIDLIKSKMK